MYESRKGGVGFLEHSILVSHFQDVHEDACDTQFKVICES